MIKRQLLHKHLLNNSCDKKLDNFFKNVCLNNILLLKTMLNENMLNRSQLNKRLLKKRMFCYLKITRTVRQSVQ